MSKQGPIRAHELFVPSWSIDGRQECSVILLLWESLQISGEEINRADVSRTRTGSEIFLQTSFPFQGAEPQAYHLQALRYYSEARHFS